MWRLDPRIFLLIIGLFLYPASVESQCGGILCAAFPSCPAGTYCGGNAQLGPCFESCLSCPAGQYSYASVGLGQLGNTCAPVDAGCYGGSGAGISCPSLCPAGQYSTGGAITCSTCPSGYYCPAGATGASICSATGYSTGGASACSPLSPGCYSLYPGSTSSCPLTYTPIITPSYQATSIPTTVPINKPTSAPTWKPTISPTISPTFTPTVVPSSLPSSAFPSAVPSRYPTLMPIVSSLPTTVPSYFPSVRPSTMPSESPTAVQSAGPTLQSASSNSKSSAQNSFIQSTPFIVVVAIGSLLCLFILISIYVLHMRWSLQSHSTQLWNWVANDLGGEVMVLMRGSKRIDKDPAPGTVVEMTVVSEIKGDERKSTKFGNTTDLGGKVFAEPIIHEGFL